MDVLVSCRLFEIKISHHERIFCTIRLLYVISAIYLMYFMMATALSVITAAIVIKIHFNGSDVTPPDWLSVLSLDLLAHFLCLQSIADWSKQHKLCVHEDIIQSKRKQLYIRTEIISPESEMTVEPITSQYDTYQLIKVPAANHCRNSREEVVDERYSKCRLSQSEYIAERWRKIAEVLDRLFFWLFLLCLTVPLASMVALIFVFKKHN
jgi:hypothetical protein